MTIEIQQEQKAIINEERNQPNRRQFLKKYGKIALYTPPAMLLLMSQQKEAVACVASCDAAAGDWWQNRRNGTGRGSSEDSIRNRYSRRQKSQNSI